MGRTCATPTTLPLGTKESLLLLTRFKKRFLDMPISQKFVSIFAVMTLFSCALMVAALHIGLSVFEEKLYEKSLQELDFFVQRIDDDL